MRSGQLVIIFTLLCICVNAQETPQDLRDLVGARGSTGEAVLRERGYTFVKTEEGEDRKWSTWWHESNRRCVTVTTFDGKYQSITIARDSDCEDRDQPSGGNDGMTKPPSWAQGTFRSNDGRVELTIDGEGRVSAERGGRTYEGRFNNGNIHVNDEVSTVTKNGSGIATFNSASDETTYYKRVGTDGMATNDLKPPTWATGTFYSENGQITLTIKADGAISVINSGRTFYGVFKDGQIVLNNDRSTLTQTDAGFSTLNLSNNDVTSYTREAPSGGNYGVDVSDLVGVNLAEGESQLGSRGYRKVDTSKKDGMNYAVWWRAQSRQCTQVTITEGRFESLTDLGSHKKCK